MERAVDVSPACPRTCPVVRGQNPLHRRLLPRRLRLGRRDRCVDELARRVDAGAELGGGVRPTPQLGLDTRLSVSSSS